MMEIALIKFSLKLQAWFSKKSTPKSKIPGQHLKVILFNARSKMIIKICNFAKIKENLPKNCQKK